MYLPKPTEFEPAPAGNHVAVCVRVVDLGTQQTPFGPKHQVVIAWELPEERMKNGEPFLVSNWYNWSMHPDSNLRRDLESWRGQAFTDADFGPGGFNVGKLLGVGCLINVIHNEDKKAVIRSVSRLPAKFETPRPHNPLIMLSLDPNEFKPESFRQLSERMQERISKAPEFRPFVEQIAVGDADRQQHHAPQGGPQPPEPHAPRENAAPPRDPQPYSDDIPF